MSVCLDSWAVLAWLDGEQPALSRVEARRGAATGDQLDQPGRGLLPPRARPRPRPRRRDADPLRATLTPDLPGTARMIEAARLKARLTIALGDCFAAATATAHRLTLLTGDPELLKLADPPSQMEDLRTS